MIAICNSNCIKKFSMQVYMYIVYFKTLNSWQTGTADIRIPKSKCAEEYQQNINKGGKM